MIAYCPKCNSQIELTSTLCTACGYDFPGSPEEADDSGHRFSLKTLLVATTVTAIVIAGVNAWLVEPRRVTNELRVRVTEMGGKMHETSRLVFISLKDRPIDDADLAKVIPLMRKCDKLISVDLSGTLVTDESIDLLDTLPKNMQAKPYVDLDTAVTDPGRASDERLRLTDPDLIDALNRLD